MGVNGNGAVPAPASLPEAAPSLSVPTRDEFVDAVASAQAGLARAIEAAALQRDPLRYVLVAVSDTLGLLVKTTRRWEGCVADVIAARQPPAGIPPEERAAMVDGVIVAAQTGAQLGAREETRRMVRRLDRATSVRIGLVVGGALVAGLVLGSALTLAAGGWFRSGPFDPTSEAVAGWREIAQNNPDVKRTLEASRLKVDPNTGRRYHEGVALWADPPRPPPAAGK